MKVVYSDYFRVDRQWHGLPLFECAFCPYATVDGMQEMIRHLEGRHGMSRRVVYQNVGRVGEISPSGRNDIEELLDD